MEGKVRLTLCAAVVIAGSGFCLGQASGSIVITVLDENQARVSGAWVTAHHAGELADTWPGSCTTGDNGTCTMRIQGPGRFALEAAKVVDKYPPRIPFYFGKNFKEDVVELREANSTASGVLHIGSKAGAVKGNVFDAVTGKALVGSAEFHWVSDQAIWIQTGISEIGRPVLVPANVPVTLVVSREGYENWKYSGPDGALKAIVLQPGQEEILNIRLQPKLPSPP
jgi:hypothetical protein